MILLAIQLLFLLAARKPLPGLPRAFVIGIGVPLLLTFASLMWSSDPSTTILKTISWLESLLVVLFVQAVLRDQYPVVVIRWIKRFALLLLVAPVLLYMRVPGFEPQGIVSQFSGDYLSFYTRLSHPFIGRSNNIATLLVILLLPLIYWAARYKAHRFATILVGTGIILTLSRGTLLAAVIAGVCMAIGTVDRAAKIARRLLQPMIVGLIVASVVIATDPTVARHLTDRFDDENIVARRQLLSEGWQALTQHMWLGLGGGAQPDVHNTYLQQFVYFGVVFGLIAVLALLGIPRWFFKSAAPKRRLDGDLTRAAGWGVVAGYLTFVTESSFEGTLLQPEIFLCFALCLALAQSARRVYPEISVGVQPIDRITLRAPT